MIRGKIKTLNDKGFGFIERGEGQKDVFFHASDLQNAHFADLRRGDDVEFEVGSGAKGPVAKNVTLIQN